MSKKPCSWPTASSFSRKGASRSTYPLISPGRVGWAANSSTRYGTGSCANSVSSTRGGKFPWHGLRRTGQRLSLHRRRAPLPGAARWLGRGLPDLADVPQPFGCEPEPIVQADRVVADALVRLGL